MKERERGSGRKRKISMTLKMVMFLCRQIIYFDLFTHYPVYSTNLYRSLLMKLYA